MEEIYIVQYKESGSPCSQVETMVSVAVKANNALVAVERANERLSNLPKEKKWLVHAVGPHSRPDDEMPE